MKRVAILILLGLFSFLFYESLHLMGANPEDGKELQLGEKVYGAQCVACHAQGGKSPIKPMNLADGDWTHGKKLDEIEKVIAKGVPGTAMMPFDKKLSKEEITAVSKYVLTFDRSE
ncbi:MAG: c-type cytochrome [Acidobacteriota bacterium]